MDEPRETRSLNSRLSVLNEDTGGTPESFSILLILTEKFARLFFIESR